MVNVLYVDPSPETMRLKNKLGASKFYSHYAEKRMSAKFNQDSIRLSVKLTPMFSQIDDLTIGTGEYYVGTLKEITKKHWKSAEAHTTCFNRSCRKAFSPVFDRPHHCRRCGEVFCASCVQFKRRLNKLAHFDPDGELYKVCKVCFDQNKLSEGQSRAHTQDFLKLRQRVKEQAANLKNNGILRVWRSRLNIERECQRLLMGFQQSVGNSEIRRTLHEVRSMLSIPDWMKSSVWIQENLAIKCQVCQENFGILKAKKFCRVCGLAVCKVCSTKDLLLYVPDEEKEGKWEPKMAIIKIIGCPEVEPEVSIYLRVCPSCKETLVERQVDAQEDDNVTTGPDFMSTLNKVHDKFCKAEHNVRLQLPKYIAVVESLEDASFHTDTQSNMKILAKAQEDLADVLAQHVTIVQHLKKLSPQTDTQSLLLKTFIRAKCDFYLENMSKFRLMKHKLNESVSPESLDFIQRIMDKNAIISTHLYLRQLVYETIHLCDKFGMEDHLPHFLMQKEQQVESEVKACLIQGEENVDEHMTVLLDMIKSRLKENKLIRLSKTQLKRKGSVHAHEMMQTRTEDILNQVNVQLQLASAYRSFPQSKRALEESLAELKKLKEAGGDEKDFVFVDKMAL